MFLRKRRLSELLSEYDGEPVYQAVAGQQPDPLLEALIPLRASAVLSMEDTETQSQRS